MKFYRIGPLTQWHDVGLAYDEATKEILGSALRCGMSTKHPDSVSINDKALKAATVSFNFMHFVCDGVEEFFPMKEAVDLIQVHGIRPYPDSDYRVLDKAYFKPKKDILQELPF